MHVQPSLARWQQCLLQPHPVPYRPLCCFAYMLLLLLLPCRFSFSWNRILPQGGKGTPVNPAGVKFYRE